MTNRYAWIISCYPSTIRCNGHEQGVDCVAPLPKGQKRLGQADRDRHSLHAADSGAESHSLAPFHRDELEAAVEEFLVEQLRLTLFSQRHIKQELDIGGRIGQFELLRENVVDVCLLHVNALPMQYIECQSALLLFQFLLGLLPLLPLDPLLHRIEISGLDLHIVVASLCRFPAL